MGIPDNFVINKIGFNNSLILSACLMSLGGGLRLLLNQSIVLVFVGQLCAGAGMPFLTNLTYYFCHYTYSNKTVGTLQ